MAASHPIIPFPSDVDRDRFGDWLSGFTDGEGCFVLALSHRPGGQPSIYACFSIKLRADDAAIIRHIQSYLQCGIIAFSPRRTQSSKPQWGMYVTNWAHLATVIVPHFDRHPLRAKKAGDYVIWREGVLLGHAVSQRPPRPRKGLGKGAKPQWTEPERTRFVALAAALREGRRYVEQG